MLNCAISQPGGSPHETADIEAICKFQIASKIILFSFLEIGHSEKAHLFNRHFAIVGERLANNQMDQQQPQYLSSRVEVWNGGYQTFNACQVKKGKQFCDKILSWHKSWGHTAWHAHTVLSLIDYYCPYVKGTIKNAPWFVACGCIQKLKFRVF